MIKLAGLQVELRGFALQDINLSVKSGDYFILVGPTGAGKTLLLEAIAGLHKVKKGGIWLDGRDMTLLGPEKRNLGMVYQDCALFPHLSVAENIAFGLRVRHIAVKSIKKELDEIASLIEIDHLMDRKPGKLSGGEKQKVALARALAIRPPLLLLDEPLSALDPETREGLQLELKRIHHALDITVIHVTHDFDEALVLGKHIAVIGAGKIIQVGTPEEIFRTPNSEFVARFTMMRNILSGVLLPQNDGANVFHSGNLELITTTRKEGARHACIRPDDITLSPDPSLLDSPNSFTGTITRTEERGVAVHVIVDLPPDICCLVTRRKFDEMGLTIGQRVRVIFNPDFIHVF